MSNCIKEYLHSLVCGKDKVKRSPLSNKTRPVIEYEEDGKMKIPTRRIPISDRDDEFVNDYDEDGRIRKPKYRKR